MVGSTEVVHRQHSASTGVDVPGEQWKTGQQVRAVHAVATHFDIIMSALIVAETRMCITFRLQSSAMKSNICEKLSSCAIPTGGTTTGTLK